MTIVTVGAMLLAGCAKGADAPQGVNPEASQHASVSQITITNGRTGQTVVIKRDDCFQFAGNPPTVTALPLSPEVVAAVISQYDDFVVRIMADRKGNPQATLLLASLQESIHKDDLERVAQKILYYKFFGKLLP